MWKNSRSDGDWRQFGCLLVVQPSGFKVGGVQKPSAWKSPRHMAGKILQGGHKEKPLLISFGVIQDHLYVVRRTQKMRRALPRKCQVLRLREDIN